MVPNLGYISPDSVYKLELRLVTMSVSFHTQTITQSYYSSPKYKSLL